MRKTNPAAERLAALAGLAALVEIIPIARPVIEAALRLGFADFENGLQSCAARTVPAIEAIVARAPKGFATGALPVPFAVRRPGATAAWLALLGARAFLKPHPAKLAPGAYLVLHVVITGDVRVVLADVVQVPVLVGGGRSGRS